MNYSPVIRLSTSGLTWLLCFISGPAVWAGEDINQTKAVDPTGTVKIHNPRGDLEIHGWDRAEVQIDGDVDDLAETVRFEVEGKITLIHIALPTKNVNWGDGSDLDIYIPHASGLHIDGVSTNIEVEDISGTIAIRTVGGDIEVSATSGRIQIETVSGDVDVNNSTGKLSVVTTSGNLDLEVDASDVFVDTMSGDVDLQLGAFDRLTAESINGALKLAGQLNPTGSIHAKTVNADISLELTKPVNAQIRATAIASGDISYSLTDDRPKHLSSRQTVLNAVAGDGSAQITLNTISGAIEIE
ncbi:MAG: DUF4097 and DUF4098 domain-containing protein YvlB [Limisphaerales bacterium]|jgi:DUF4097 and DUF4098 domain-containing protein YvlB